jgi:hypothetical protein
LVPAAISKRRVVRGRRGKMPLLISSIEAGAMSARNKLVRIKLSSKLDCVTTIKAGHRRFRSAEDKK